jgi:amidohydrolase
MEMIIMKQEHLELVKALRHELHEHPEPSNYEQWTKSRLMDFLKVHTKLEVIDRGLWFYAFYDAGENKPNIAFRADFDAIMMDEGCNLAYGSKNPGVAHKCGHDGHSATLVGLALEIDQEGADKNVYFLFQHAEETGDGAAECVDLMLEKNIEAIYAYHNISGFPLKSVNVIDGTSNFASKGMTIEMLGAPSHASQPEKGRNPAYAIAKLIDALPGWTDDPANRGLVLSTVIQVAIGEKAFGISASEGRLLITIRAQFEDELDRLNRQIEGLALKLSDAFGLKTKFMYNDEFPMVFNHKESNDKIRKVCQNEGLDVLEMPSAFRFSEDFGHYLKVTKGAICYIGNGETYAPIHTHDYDFPDEIIETAITLFKGLIKE